MPATQERRWLRYSLRGSLLVITMFCVFIGWRVNRSHRQQRAMELLKAKGTFLYHSQYDAFAIIMHKLTGTWEYGYVWEIVLSHDIYGPTQIAYVPQDIDLLKDVPCLTTLHVHSSQCEDTVVRLAEVGSLELVGLHAHTADDPCVITLKRLRPNLRVVTK